MLDQLPPHLKRWALIALLTVAAIWLVFHPQYLFEQLDERQQGRTSQSGAKTSPSPSTIDRANNRKSDQAEFDFYVLALSWSPSFCAAKNRTSGLQCGGKRFFSFIVHGLWPQYEKGWPSNCDAKVRQVNSNLVNSMLDIMPAKGLIQHEWKKHGTCSGLGQRGYFAKLRKAYEKIRFPARYRLNDRYLMVSPDEMEEAFGLENPGLGKGAIAITCDKRRLREVRICFSRDLQFRACQQVDRNSCRRQKIVMPPVRGA